jgi:hypothetical protein
VIYADGTLAGTVNDAPGVWAALWRTQVRLGMIPRTMALVPVTGPRTHFRVTLARAQQIFATAYANVSGLARTVRGPAMRDERGLVRIAGTVVADGRNVFVLRYLQARDPGLAGTPFFAAFSADAAWLTDLRPAPGTRFPPAALVLLRRDDRPAGRLHLWHCCQHRIAVRSDDTSQIRTFPA